MQSFYDKMIFIYKDIAIIVSDSRLRYCSENDEMLFDF